MKPLELTYEAKQRIWTKLSQQDCDYLIFLTTCNLHAVEACVAVTERETIDEFEYFILKALGLLGTPNVEELNSLLHIGRQVILQITVKMKKEGLLWIADNGNFAMTDLGKKSLESGLLVKLQTKRRIFYFIDQSNEFVRIDDRSNDFLVDLEPNDITSDWKFNTKALQACIGQSDDWKKHRQFPLDIHELIMPSSKKKYDGLSKPQTLIIDKAQSVKCAILVKFENDMPSELFAYPISRRGYLLDTDSIFSLMGADTIIETFPFVMDSPEEKQLYTAFKDLEERHSLGNIDNISLQTHRNHIKLKINNDISINWTKFYWKHAQGNIFCDTTSTIMTRLNKLTIESNHLQAVKLLHEISESCLLENNLRDILAYDRELSTKGISSKVTIRNLASLAWDLDNYRLAYSLAELEDMADANL